MISGTIEILQTEVNLPGILVVYWNKIEFVLQNTFWKAKPLKLKIKSLERGIFCMCRRQNKYRDWKFWC
jgi:hypothetical protein